MKPPVQLGEGVGRRHLFMTVWQQATGNPDLDLPGLDIGDHLQCAVAVYEQEGRTVVAALDPAAGMQGWEHEGKAAAASRALEAALGRVAAD